ncbi:alkylated DNA repair protein alkB 8-like [Vespula squamosa]|uniref:Alkylated DNA repair protein alkB 8-like n=1 Tax=Vespula squamosa TaxID=30214 RepID=A0ABD2BYK3_VESSQ
MPQGGSYCFIKSQLETDAIELLHDLYNQMRNSILPSVLKVTEDFINIEEEKSLLNVVDWTKRGNGIYLKYWSVNVLFFLLGLFSFDLKQRKKGDVKVNVFLPQYSLLLLTGKALYARMHGISSKYGDLIKTNGVVK